MTTLFGYRYTDHTLVLRSLLATNRSATRIVAKPTRKKLAASCCVTMGKLKIFVLVSGSVGSILVVVLISHTRI